MNVWLCTNYEGYVVEATQVGDTPYAVHESVFGYGYWCVTHTPSGFSAGKGFRTKQIAMAFAVELDEQLVDVDSMETENPRIPKGRGLHHVRAEYLLK